MEQWIGVDLDGTLADMRTPVDPRYMIPLPVPRMVDIVKMWLAEGLTVKIFTARMSENPTLWQKRIGDWCAYYIGVRLEATNVKDFGCVAIYDDIAVKVMPNTGEIPEWDRVISSPDDHRWKPGMPWTQDRSSM